MGEKNKTLQEENSELKQKLALATQALEYSKGFLTSQEALQVVESVLQGLGSLDKEFSTKAQELIIIQQLLNVTFSRENLLRLFSRWIDQDMAGIAVENILANLSASARHIRKQLD